MTLSGLFAGATLHPARASDTLDFDGLPLIVDETFPADEYVRRQALFWVNVYLKTGQNEGWLHDPLFPELVFRKVTAPQGKAGRRTVDDATLGLQTDLRAAFGDSSAWTPERRRLRALLPQHWDSTAVELCAQRIRFQRGLRERYRAGLERSYRYLPLIDSVFAAEGVPARLKFLPHVESSFHPYAYSKVGAAGMWQFMKSTGRKFLKVDYYVDERRDPVVSTRAAAKMLQRNFARIQSWPLAIMAYNHGPDGVARAVAATGSKSMGTVLQSYYSNTFGFASRNFYAEFLAASTVALLADSLFPDLDKWEPLEFRELVLPRALSARAVSERTGLSLAQLEEYNLALRPSVFKGKAQLPKSYALRVPLTLDTAAVAARLGTAAVQVASATPAPKAQPVSPAADKAETKIAAAEPARPAPPPKRGTSLRPETPAAPAVPALIPQSGGQAEALARPAPIAPAAPPVFVAAATHAVVDSSFALQLSDWEKVGHPWDRFLPGIYNLEHRYEDGALIVRVGPEETLSHFAEWSGLSAAAIRGDNGLRRKGDFRMNRAIRLRLAPPAAEAFVRKREEYFRGLEEDFYARYHVEALEPLAVKRGANVWNLAQEKEIPFWLFLKHNPGRRLDALMPGDTLSLPMVEEGWRRWGFTRYANAREYLHGVRRFLAGAGGSVP